MGDTKKKYALGLLINDNFVNYAKVAVKSFLDFNEWFDGDIIYIYHKTNMPLSDENKESLMELYKNTIFHNTDAKLYTKLINKSKKAMALERWNYVFYKFEIFDYTDYDKILFIDADILFVNNCYELFEYDYPFMMGLDNPSSHDLSFEIEKQKDYINTQYCNVGVFLIDKKLYNYITKDEIIKRSIDCNINEEIGGNICCHKYLFMPEQDAINVVLNQYTYLFPMTYNMFSGCFSRHITSYDLYKKLHVIHYAGDVKPDIEEVGNFGLPHMLYFAYLEGGTKALQDKARDYFAHPEKYKHDEQKNVVDIRKIIRRHNIVRRTRRVIIK